MKLFVFLMIMLGSVWIASAEDRRTVTIFHTNDIHGHFTPERASWRRDGGLVGGVAALEFYLDSLRRVYPENLYLDAGDLMTGHPICKLEYNGVRGGALLKMLAHLNIAAMCLGNHEFDLGADHVRDFIHSARFPVLCANIHDDERDQRLTASTHLLNVNGVRIGVIGLILDGLKNVVARANIESFQVEDAVASAQKHIDELEPDTDLIILLTHMGVDDDSLLATRVHGADIIVGGHSHTRLTTPRTVNGVVIAQAGSYCKNLGVLTVTMSGDSVIRHDGKLVELAYRDDFPRTSLAAFADSFEVVIQARYGQVIGELAELWKPGYYEGSNAGNWICDRLREQFASDVALINSGGLRTTWNPGTITMLDVLEMLPFENAVTVFEATGADLMTIALEQARAHGLHLHGALEMSGLSVEYRKRNGGVDVTSVTVNGKPVVPESSYRVASIDYITVSQPERYLNVVPQRQETSTQLLSDFVMEQIRNHAGPLYADSTPRIREVP